MLHEGLNGKLHKCYQYITSINSKKRDNARFRIIASTWIDLTVQHSESYVILPITHRRFFITDQTHEKQKDAEKKLELHIL